MDLLKIILCLMCLICRESLHGATPKTSNKLLAILLDGFRWDYVRKFNLPNFKRLQQIGAHAGYLQNDFPTLSTPNYYTLMTGVHTESHGMSGNFMFAMNRMEAFLNMNNTESKNEHWWSGGEPVWVTVLKQDKRAYVYHLQGCDVDIQGTKPTFCEPYVPGKLPSITELEETLKSAIGNLTESGDADLAVVYYEDPDYIGHKYGPDSSQMKSVLKSIDKEIGKVIETLGQQQANVLIFSDHGMTSIDQSRVINMSQVLSDPSLYLVILEAGSIASIYTTSQQSTHSVYTLLKNFSTHMKVYKTEDLPDRYHYKRGKYVANITCVADLGWTIVHPFYPTFLQKDGQALRGYHGYDNKHADMRGIFYAFGPYFKPRTLTKYMEAVDVYHVMCDVLCVSPAPNSGSRSRTRSLLSSQGTQCPVCY